MVYAVDRYIDQIRVKEKREFDPILKKDKYVYFDTEREARDFIRSRARASVIAAEQALYRAERRENKCYRKFPPIKLTEPQPN